MKTRKMKCNECGGTLELNEDRDIICCPYCGSKELIEESDEVKIERIKSKTRLKEKELHYKHEEELNKISDNEVKIRRDDNKTDRYKIIYSGFLGLLLLFLIIAMIFVCYYLPD